MKNSINLTVILILASLCFYFYKENKQLKKDVEYLSNHMVSAHSSEDSLKATIDSLTRQLNKFTK